MRKYTGFCRARFKLLEGREEGILKREILRDLDDLTDPYNYRDRSRGSQQITR
jgi:hypothetical protein